MDINGQFQTPATMETPLRRYWIGGWLGSKVGHDTVAKTKVLVPSMNETPGSQTLLFRIVTDVFGLYSLFLVGP
jgi:hypothetical protein